MSQNVLVELSDALADAAEKAGKATVLVNARRRMPASGIVYSSDLVLTADHVIEREDGIKILIADGSELGARLVGRDGGSDMAVLKLDRAVGMVAEATKPPARLGQIALALGRPSPEGIEASLGTVSAIGGPIRTGRGGMLERYIRLFTVSIDLDVGLNLEPMTTGNGTTALLPVLSGLETDNIQVSVLNSDFVTDSKESLEAVLPTVLDLALPLITGAIPAMSVIPPAAVMNHSGATVAATEYTYAVPVPTAISVFMSAVRLRSVNQPVRWMGHPV